MIDITIPRECVYQQFEEQPGPCPRCSGPLRSHTATYLVDTRSGGKSTDSFFIGNDMGWFCARCPTVVINPEEVSEFLMHSLPHWNVGTEFAVLGIVDLDAIPEEKQNLPLGHDDNPVPLVAFTNIDQEQASRSPSGTPEIPSSRRVSSARGGDFEERYEDVLQNIEFGIIRVYRDHPELADWDALNAVEALLRVYQAEAKGRQATLPSLTSLAQDVFDSVKPMCEWRLGRETFVDKAGKPMEMSPDPITLDEIAACLKRIRKSINRWNRRSGRQGYLTFVDQYIA
ncbi:MAG: hypothetical protein SXV54_15585 [Chloroflexota bacterium]|nr:hypothetical protein [Chloroflexota bacterium]